MVDANEKRKGSNLKTKAAVTGATDSTTDMTSEKRPLWPRKALVTAGMPYGNKTLHFGHIGGVFVPADVFARFLRDRIGEENVLFICGTDCYGSPIEEEYRKRAESGLYTGSIEEFVAGNHQSQAEALKSYAISLDIFEGSGIGVSKRMHKNLTDEIILHLYADGHLHKLSTAQFFDESAQTFLNGRQVVGRCPVQGCKSEKGYADECDLGHQYLPEDLIDPISTVSGEKPVMREVSNWYFDLPAFCDLLKAYVAEHEAKGLTRGVVLKTIEEFLGQPIIYVKDEFLDEYENLKASLPSHLFRATEKGKTSFELIFNDFTAREAARDLLVAAGLRFRTGKALVPFRITGNIAWGVAAPVLEDTSGLTVWCWPESLWAPISFTQARLAAGAQGVESLNPARREDNEESWESYWCNPEACVYQFIGQDNIYFYGIAQTAMWNALPVLDAANNKLQQSQLIANYHLQFLGKKASSSGVIRPPMADELLNHYTPEQLRAHFIALGLGQRPVSFQPKPLNPDAVASEGDPVLKDGSLLTNVLNRLARSCFYAAHNDNGGLLPLYVPADELVWDVRATLEEYENLMYRQEFHNIMHLADGFIRRANKYWADNSRASTEDAAKRRIAIANAFYLLKAACLMMHPVAPCGTSLVFEYLNLNIDERDFFSWKYAFEGLEAFMTDEEIAAGGHAVKELPPHFDFFSRHPSQFE